MKPWSLLLGTLAFAASASCAARADAPARPVELTVSLPDPAQKVLYVHETMPVAPGKLTLYYPKYIPGDHAPDGPIGTMMGLEITAGGKRVAWQRDPVDMFTFHLEVPAGADSIDIRFQFPDTDTVAAGRNRRPHLQQSRVDGLDPCQQILVFLFHPGELVLQPLVALEKSFMAFVGEIPVLLIFLLHPKDALVQILFVIFFPLLHTAFFVYPSIPLRVFGSVFRFDSEGFAFVRAFHLQQQLRFHSAAPVMDPGCQHRKEHHPRETYPQQDT